MQLPEIIASLEDLQKRLLEGKRLLRLEDKKLELESLNQKMSAPDFWQDQKNAQDVSQKASDLKGELELWSSLETRISDLLSLAREDKEDKSTNLTSEIEDEFNKLKLEFSKVEFQMLFSGEYDESNCLLAIHAGTGGTDAMDWAEMLLRMYLRYTDKKGFKVEVIDESRGGEAGIKSVMLEIKGRYAYGYLQSEAGVHRLVRISPFDAEKMRHTSFALVEVLPELESSKLEDIKIKDEDLRIDTFLSSGHGGQSVNTTYSAVRVVHLPTKITVSCQNERSQQQNKETALKILKNKLFQLQVQKEQAEKEKLRGEYHEAAWSNQSRSYVLHPYKMVKDHRTDYENQEVENVLEGELDELVESYLKWKIASHNP